MHLYGGLPVSRLGKRIQNFRDLKLTGILVWHVARRLQWGVFLFQIQVAGSLWYDTAEFMTDSTEG